MRSKFQKRSTKTGLSPGNLIHIGKSIALNKKMCSIYSDII
jgi:hypothetical protein